MQGIRELERLLLQEQPENFSPSWIKEKDHRLYARLLQRAREGGKVEWSLIIDKLQAPWPDRWQFLIKPWQGG